MGAHTDGCLFRSRCPEERSQQDGVPLPLLCPAHYGVSNGGSVLGCLVSFLILSRLRTWSFQLKGPLTLITTGLSAETSPSWEVTKQWSQHFHITHKCRGDFVRASVRRQGTEGPDSHGHSLCTPPCNVSTHFPKLCGQEARTMIQS